MEGQFSKVVQCYGREHDCERSKWGKKGGRELACVRLNVMKGIAGTEDAGDSSATTSPMQKEPKGDKEC